MGYFFRKFYSPNSKNVDYIDVFLIHLIMIMERKSDITHEMIDFMESEIHNIVGEQKQ